MGTMSNGIFQQARLLVAQAEREMGELAARFEQSFHLSREEKEELRPCAVDAYDSWSIELAPRDGSATFLMTPQDDRTWALAVARGDDAPMELGKFHAGLGGSEARRRLRAARVVTAIGSWLEDKAPVAPASIPDHVVSLEGKAYIEFKAQTHVPAQASQRARKTESQETATQPRTLDSAVAGAQPAQGAQPRWLDMLPNAQASEAEPVPPALLEARPQVSFRLGKIFGH